MLDSPQKSQALFTHCEGVWHQKRRHSVYVCVYRSLRSSWHLVGDPSAWSGAFTFLFVLFTHPPQLSTPPSITPENSGKKSTFWSKSFKNFQRSGGGPNPHCLTVCRVPPPFDSHSSVLIHKTNQPTNQLTNQPTNQPTQRTKTQESVLWIVQYLKTFFWRKSTKVWREAPWWKTCFLCCFSLRSRRRGVPHLAG